MTEQLPVLAEPVHLSFDVYGPHEPALLLVHGYPLDHTIWAQQVTDLKNVCQVIVPDLRGHGKSPAPKGAYSVDVMARDLLYMLDQIGVFRAVWAGHSMGGYVVYAAYRLAPERFAGVAFIASNHKADSDEARAKRYETADKVAQQGASAALNPKLFHPDSAVDPALRKQVDQVMLNTPPDGIIGTLNAMATRPDSSETAKQMHIPALVIGGAGDQLFKPEIPQEMAQLIPDAKLIMAEKSGHLPMMEQPELVSDALMTLMKSVKSA